MYANCSIVKFSVNFNSFMIFKLSLSAKVSLCQLSVHKQEEQIFLIILHLFNGVILLFS